MTPRVGVKQGSQPATGSSSDSVHLATGASAAAEASISVKDASRKMLHSLANAPASRSA